MPATDSDLERLKKAVSGWITLPEEEWNAFAVCWHPVEYRRKTILTAAGEVERYVYFVLEGVQRAYFLGEGRREATLIFSYTGSFSGIADSFQLQQPSRYYLETLTASRLLRLSYADFDRLLGRYPSLERWGRLATSTALSGLMERYIELMTYTAEEKFRVLLTRSPHVLQLIPHKYLASYLGLDPTTFSKLMASVKL
ncbi:Crp/Fnr family transcriptional regulator [Larkinella soli]|uniref:Crp/Fnr family transcriptional regulator n=1 Tax=Larkinella soli TaxID=1770527 RepID=UPI000FFC2862|nr:Crp/Fnr family transcriptional regulator [Larkinella soli]